MKFYVITTAERVLHSYLRRNFEGITRGNTTCVPEHLIGNQSLFKSFCKNTSGFNKSISIKKARVPALENLSSYEWGKLIFMDLI